MNIQFCLRLGLIIFVFIHGISASAKNTELKVDKFDKKEVFTQAENTFKNVMETLLSKYIDKNLTKEELYMAATQGMLNSLNKDNKEWNKLLSPNEYKNLQIDLSGKVTGIGAEMKFDEQTGYATILRTITNSAAEKAGIKVDDQILSVNGEKFKGRTFPELVAAIRGEVGKTVELKVLREDKIVNFNINREVVPWSTISLEKLDRDTGFLTIGFFNEDTPAKVQDKISEINKANYKNLIVDLRDNSGGAFDPALKTTELFLSKGAVMLKTLDRSGKTEEYKSTKGMLNNSIKIFVLVDKNTSSSAEFFTSALKENRQAKIIGEKTFGKWTAQMVETLPNQYAIKYTVKQFLTPEGKSFQDIGLKPDIEVPLTSKSTVREIKLKYSIGKRAEFDSQLKVAIELTKNLN